MEYKSTYFDDLQTINPHLSRRELYPQKEEANASQDCYTYSKHKGLAGVVAGRAALSVQDDCVPVHDVCERVVRVCVQHRCGMRRVIAWDRGGAVQGDRDRVSVTVQERDMKLLEFS